MPVPATVTAIPIKNALTAIRLIFLDVLFTQNHLLRDDAFDTAGEAAVQLEPAPSGAQPGAGRVRSYSLTSEAYAEVHALCRSQRWTQVLEGPVYSLLLIQKAFVVHGSFPAYPQYSLMIRYCLISARCF